MHEPRPHPTGWIEVVVGPMYSGKTEELIRRLRRAHLPLAPVLGPEALHLGVVGAIELAGGGEEGRSFSNSGS